MKIIDVHGNDVTKTVDQRKNERIKRKLRNLRRYENRYYRIAAQRSA